MMLIRLYDSSCGSFASLLSSRPSGQSTGSQTLSDVLFQVIGSALMAGNLDTTRLSVFAT